ncbi:FimV/HubP family polar landmark protein [Acidovorax sp.]|uniref:FimV/HubP family polar landmark protein n=1 Tax=Acidovorax sp. TaxID=1872122 RepID=UPI002ACE0E47|nr:FimV/HubP family polar landmark protein [Acidovorax sp.]MDZ7866701.1 FimV/HubP family polar landmark protein [Acidovorax sp.]
MANMHRWKFSVLAAAAVATAGLYATDASALALGRITVQSALGEPLRAEIDLPQITPAEAETLKASTATPEVFRAQGMEYSPTMNNLQVQLQRRADGSAVLRLSSDRPVNDPFVDLVLDATWGSGRLVRSYTMLFDPPAMRRPAPTVTAAPQITPPASRTETPPAVAGRPSSAAAPAAAARAPAAPRATPAEGSVTVQPGDTAGRIANANRPDGVSLDQMLVAMQRANPDAFIGGNINRVKAGAVLQMPDQATAQATPAPEARQILAAQSRDFNAFRRKLAESAPSTTVASAERSATGSVQTRVEDSKPATTAPDKLTLSKGSVKGQKAAEDQLAKDKQASDASARMAELSKNISDLNKLGAASAAAPSTPATPAAPPVAAPAAPAASTPAQVAVPGVPATPAAPEAPPAMAASEPTSGASAEASASPASDAAPAAPAAPASKPIVLPPPTPVAEPGFFDGLLDDPLIPLAGGGLLALLLGYGAYRVIQRRRNNAGVDSSFLESRIQPDSFFGASGGQRVDTANSEMTTGSSMAYSPSQLDAGGDVDPVAEADVYLAYGRDLQAEEILKEAVRHNPARVSVHVKLAEIYAKRQDRKALEAVAGEVFKLTQGEGPDWARIVDLGRGIEPENPLYQPGGRPGMVEDESPSVPGAFVSTFTGAPVASAALPPDLDLDLDLDLPDDALTDAPPAPPGGFAAAAAAATATAAAPAPRAPQRMEPVLSSDDFDLPDLSADAAWNAPAPAPTPAPAARAAAPSDELTMAPTGPMPLADAQDSGPMDFDLGELSLDLTAPSKPMAAPASREVEIPTAAVPISPEDDGSAAAQDDPLATKLALAEEFNAIGDTDGARTLIEEVVAESSGALRTRAQRMLVELG